MTKFAKRLRQLATTLCLLSITVSSCVQEPEVEVEDIQALTEFDSELTSALDLMDSDPVQAIEMLDGVIADAEAVGSKYYSGKSKWYKAYIYDAIQENVSEAYRFYNEALRDVLQTDDSTLKMKIYNNLGVLHRFYGEYDGAIATYEDALDLADDLDEEQLSNLYYNLGIALKLKGDEASFSEAELAFTKSLEYAKEIDFDKNIAKIHNQIGLMYKALENYDMARMAYRNTIETYVSEPEMLDYVGKAYHGIGVTFMDEGNLEASIRAFKKALEYKRSSGSIFITKYDLGTVLLREGKQGDAIAIWKDALKEKHNKNSREQVKIYSDLTSVLKLNNQYEEALNYSEVYNASIQKILQEDEKYKEKSDRVLFANVVNEYAEFNKPEPFFSRPLVILFSILTLIAMTSAVAYALYRARAKRKISEVVSDIQSEFLDIRVD